MKRSSFYGEPLFSVELTYWNGHCTCSYTRNMFFGSNNQTMLFVSNAQNKFKLAPRSYRHLAGVRTKEHGLGVWINIFSLCEHVLGVRTCSGCSNMCVAHFQNEYNYRCCRCCRYFGVSFIAQFAFDLISIVRQSCGCATQLGV